MMDEAKGGVDGLMWPFHEQTGKAEEMHEALPNYFHMHMFSLHSTIHIYLSSQYFSLYLFACLSSIKGKHTCLDVKCNGSCLLFFFSRSDSRSVIVYKSMRTLISIYNLVNQHPADFILNH